jgi:hypothetical protein
MAASSLALPRRPAEVLAHGLPLYAGMSIR